MKRYVQLLASLWHEAADTASCNRSCIDLADVRTATFEDLTDYPTCLAVRNHEYVAASRGIQFRCERRKPIVIAVLPLLRQSINDGRNGARLNIDCIRPGRTVREPLRVL